MKTSAALIVVAGLLGLPGRAIQAQVSAPELLSTRATASSGPRTGNGPSVPVGLDAQGRYVFFLGAASDLVAGDRNGARWDLFRRDLLEARTEWVSSFGPDSRGPWANTLGAAIASDGAGAVFQTRTPAPGVRDENGVEDLFLRRMSNAAPELVSVRADGLAAGDAASGPGLFSGDGRFVVFESRASDLVSGTDTNGQSDVFLRDLETRTTRLLSARTRDGQTSTEGARAPLVDHDAGVVLFRSASTNLTDETDGNVTDLYVWRRADGSLRRVVLPGPIPEGGQTPVRVLNPALSRDGRQLAFRASATQAIGTPTALDGVWFVDLALGTQIQISNDPDANRQSRGDDLTGPVWAGDGRRLAFERNTATPTNPVPRIHLWGAGTGLQTLDQVAAATPGAPAEPVTSQAPVLNVDGSRLAFLSAAPVSGTTLANAGIQRLLVRELATGHTLALTSEADGNVDQPFAEFHPDGRRVLFQTERPVPGPVEDWNRTFDVLLSAGTEGVPPTVVSVADPAQSTSVPSELPHLAGRALSEDGHYVLFARMADAGSVRHVYRLDRRTSALRLVSRGLAGGEANGHSLPVALSAEGRRVLFTSLATNLVAGDTNRVEDAFLADLDADTIELVNARDADGGFSARAVAAPLSMSADGRQIAFHSRARDLASGMAGSADNNLFLRDLDARRTIWINRDVPTLGIVDIQGRIRTSTLSEDGRFLAFTAGPTPPGDAYLHSRTDGSLRRLTTGGRVHALAVSGRSGLVALAHRHPDGTRNRLALHDIVANATREVVGFRLEQTLVSLRFSADGQSLVFGTVAALPSELTGVTDDNGLGDVFHYDLRSSRLRLLSIDPSGKPGAGASDQPDLSADGQWVVFRHRAVPITPVSTGVPEVTHVFLHSLATGRTTLLDPAPVSAGPGNGPSAAPRIGADGSLALFLSGASDFGEGIGNGLPGLFVVRLAPDVDPGLDTDQDGLPDAWEQASFGNLAETGTGDPDRDGQSNAAEFQSGTSPTDPLSVFRVEVSLAADGVPTLRWWAVAGITYSIESSGSIAPAAFVVQVTDLRGDGALRVHPLISSGTASFIRVRAQRP